MDLYIFDEQINLLGICDNITTLSWTMRHSSAGGFKLSVPATERNIKNLQKHRYIYRQDVNEAMYISSIQEQRSSGQSKMLMVTGRSLDGLYRKRMLPTVDKNSVLKTLEKCVNFGCPIEYDFSLDCKPPTNSSIDYQTTAEDYLRFALLQNNYGFFLQLNPAKKCMEAKIVQPKDLSGSIMFSEENILNGLYEYSDDNSVTYVFGRAKYPGNDVELPEGGMPTYTVGAEKTGLERSELNVLVDPVVKTGIRIVYDPDGTPHTVEYKYVDVPETLEILEEACKAEILEPSENFNGNVNPKEYRKAFNVGDIVTIRNDERGISFTKRAEEVQETMSSDGSYITPTFGQPLKTIFDYI